MLVKSRLSLLAASMASVALFGLAATAKADGMYQAGTRYSPFSWTGFYLGAHAGWEFTDIDHTYDINTAAQHKFHYDADGFAGGVHGGKNFQTGSIVLGVEGDWSWSNAKGTGLCVAACAGTGSNPTFHVNSTGSLRGRAGLAVDRTLWYLTAGVAAADVKITDVLQAGRVGGIHVGLVAGGGVEWAVTRDISFRTEYLFADYERKNYPLVTTPDRIGFDTSTVRAGITWHFGNREEPRPLK